MKPILTIYCAFMLTMAVNAQKLPNIQKESVPAPENVKIDGNTDWLQNQFKAYNKSTHIFYTIANDDNNLYVIIKADDKVIMEKMLVGGITFTVENPVGNKKTAPVSITSPLIPLKNMAHILHPIGDTSIKITDALPGMNKELEDNSKEVGITGFKDIPDSLISVYDNHGIKTFSLFTGTVAYVYELAVPLKYFNNPQDIHYNIRINGVKNAGYNYTLNGKAMSMSSPEAMNAMMTSAAHGMPAAMANLEKITPTDLSGIYTLAK